MRISNNGLYVCAKQNVVSVLVALNGKVYIGYNGCDKQVEECPRKDMKSGIGYELCKSVCKQTFHSEENACKQAGIDANGATIYLFNHTYCCDSCIFTMQNYGIHAVIFPLLNKVQFIGTIKESPVLKNV